VGRARSESDTTHHAQVCSRNTCAHYRADYQGQDERTTLRTTVWGYVGWIDTEVNDAANHF